MIIRFLYVFAVIAAVAMPLGELATAQDVQLTVNRETQAITVSNADAAPAEIFLYEVRSASGALDPSDGVWNSLFDTGFGTNGWFEANPSTNLLAELNNTQTTTLDAAGGAQDSFSLGTPFDSDAAKQAAGFGVDVEDLVFVYGGPNIPTQTGTVNYEGNREFNTLVVNINPGTGSIEIENESPFDVTLTGYQISSPAGALDDTWSGIRGSNANWESIGVPSSGQLAELENSIGGGLFVPAAGTVSLGNAYTMGEPQDSDLEFTFLLLGDESDLVGGVKYDVPPIGDGDFDTDGDTDGTDFLRWQRGEAPNGGTAQELTDWLNGYPSPLSGLSAVGAVPEPSSAAMMLAAVALFSGRRKRV